MAEAKKNSEMIRAIGRRKTAAARIRSELGSGRFIVNDKEMTAYFPIPFWQEKVVSPLIKTGKEKNFDISVRVVGGGINSQSEAVRHGVARALVLWDATLKPVLKAEKFLTRDPRAKERKKFGRHKARRGHQWRKR